MSVLDDIAKEYLYQDEDMPPELFVAWLKHQLDLELALFKKELIFCETVEEMRKVYKTYVDENSTIRKIEKALADSYKQDRENKIKQ